MNFEELRKQLKVSDAESVTIYPDFETSRANYRNQTAELIALDRIRPYYSWGTLPEELYPKIDAMAQAIAANEALSLFFFHAYEKFTKYENFSFVGFPRLDAMLGEESTMFYIVLLYSSFPLLEERYRERGIPVEYARALCDRVKEVYDTYRAGYGRHGMNPQQVTWYRYYLDFKIFRIGRFEYMPEKGKLNNIMIFRNRETGKILGVPGPEAVCYQADGFQQFHGEDPKKAAFRSGFIMAQDGCYGIATDPATGTAVPGVRHLRYDEWEMIVGPDDDILDLHIPGGGRMTPEACADSFREAFQFMRKYFPEKIFRAIISISWIFSPYYEKVMPESNVARLMRELYLYPAWATGTDGTYFLFGRADVGHDGDDYSSYPADTAPRRAMLDALKTQGKVLRNGGMFILEESLDDFGKQPYRNALRMEV